MNTRQYKRFKGLKKENLRDNMSTTEIVLNMLAEASTKDISQAEAPETFAENQQVARKGGEVAGIARQALEARTGKPVITPQNALDFHRLIEDVMKKPQLCRRRRSGANDGPAAAPHALMPKKEPTQEAVLSRAASVCRKSPPAAAFSARCLRNVCAKGANSPPARQSRAIRIHFGGPAGPPSLPKGFFDSLKQSSKGCFFLCR